MEPLPDLWCGDRQVALFLDVDGTLLDLAEHPDLVIVPPDLVRVLVQLRDSLGGAVALVSGRSLAALDALLGEAKLDAAGCHGAEIRIAGAVCILARADDLVSELSHRLAQLVDGVPETMVEVKAHSIALHYRPQFLDAGAALALARRALGSDADRFRILSGKQVVEVLPVGAGKGVAISTFLDRAPYHGRLPVFAGDDVTDEEGFAEVNRRSGISVRVGVNGASSIARFRASTAAALVDWLKSQLRPQDGRA